MDEWWTYQIEDLILFSSHTYYRLIELYNVSVWPLQLAAILLGIIILVLTWRRPHWHGKAVSLILALGFLLVAMAFHWQRFANIHWVAIYFALAFAIQAGLLLWAGVVKNKLVIKTDYSETQFIGFGILGFALFIQPFVMMLAGHHWKQAELFALMPDPTVTATIGILLLTDIRKHWWLLIIPLLWCLVSAATLWALNSVNAFVVLTIGLISLFDLSWKMLKHQRNTT